jgi:hypothetical protein
MLQVADVTELRTRSATALTVRGTITTGVQSVAHVQYLTAGFVITEIGRSLIVHSSTLGGRFVVDRTRGRLRRVDPGAQTLQIEHLRELVGAVSVHRDEETIEVEGFRCQRYRLCNDSSRIVVAAEAFCTRFGAVAATALHDERQLEAKLHPFALPLQPDELVVKSTTRTYANGFQHTQSYQLSNLADYIEDLESLETPLAYPIDEL